MSSVHFRVAELIENFDRNAKTLHSHQYNETQIRREFIDTFFEELGWVVTNKAGNSHGGWPIKQIEGKRQWIDFCGYKFIKK